MAGKIIYQNQRVIRLWFVSIVCLSTSIFVTYATLTMKPETDLHDYSNIWSMRLWQGFFLLLGNILTLTLCWLSGKYVLDMRITEEGMLSIRTWSLFCITRTYHLSQQSLIPGSHAQHSGITTIPGRPMVIAPWDSIRTVQGQRLVIDIQGVFPEGYTVYQRVLGNINT
jgi:hypothetical protein